MDGNLKFGGTDYTVYSRLALSRAGQDEDRDSGYEGAFYVSKFSCRIGGQAYADVRSKGFDANDLGFMSRNNRITAGTHLKFDMLEPYWFGRRTGFNLNVWHHRNLDGDELNRGINYNMWHRFKTTGVSASESAAKLTCVMIWLPGEGR